MRRFVLERKEDVSGVSGTGTVAEGVEFSDGKVALRWTANTEHQSTVLWDAMESVEVIHGHDGRTTVRWLDKKQPEGRDEVIELIKADRKINAIKELRALEGMGLKEAKEEVERLQAELGIPTYWERQQAEQAASDARQEAVQVGRRATPWKTRRDRMVHGTGVVRLDHNLPLHVRGINPGTGYEIVRYDIQARYFVEYENGLRKAISLGQAVALTDVPHFGKPGGNAFDSAVAERVATGVQKIVDGTDG